MTRPVTVCGGIGGGHVFEVDGDDLRFDRRHDTAEHVARSIRHAAKLQAKRMIEEAHKLEVEADRLRAEAEQLLRYTT